MVTERRELQGERLSRISSPTRQVQTRVSLASGITPAESGPPKPDSVGARQSLSGTDHSQSLRSGSAETCPRSANPHPKDRIVGSTLARSRTCQVITGMSSRVIRRLTILRLTCASRMVPPGYGVQAE